MKVTTKKTNTHLFGIQFINPRPACTARVIVLGLSFCPSVRLSVTTFSPTTRNKTAKSDTNGFSATLALFDFGKNFEFESYGMNSKSRS